MIHSRKRLIAAFLSFAAFAAVVSGRFVTADELPTIYVKALVPGQNVKDSDAAKVSSELESAVINSKRYRVMSQSQVKELFRNMEFQQGIDKDCNTDACLRQIMKTTRTDYLLYGEITREEGEYAVRVSLMHRKRGGDAEVVKTATEFTTTFNLRAITGIAGFLVRRIHDQKVSEQERSKITGADVGDLLSFHVSSTPPGAELFINNARRGATPRKLSYPEGDFRGVLKHHGFKDHIFTIKLPQTRQYDIVMERTVHTIRITTAPGAPEGIAVSEAGKALGTLGAKGLSASVTSGDHILTFEREGYVTKNVGITVTGDMDYRVRLERQRYTLRVDADVPSADVYLDGKKAGRTPFERTLDHGDYGLLIKKDGYIDLIESVRLRGNRVINAVMRKVMFVPFRVESKPSGAEVHFGGKLRGKTPDTFQWPEGELEVTAILDGRRLTKTAILSKRPVQHRMEFDFGYAPLSLETKPTGAEAFIGSKRLGITPLDFEWREGVCDITLKHGGRNIVHRVNVTKGKAPQRIMVDLTEPAHGTAKTVGGMEFVYIRSGIFWMGSKEGFGNSNERPRHSVEVSGFWMGKYEVTQKQYQAVMGKNPSYFKGLFKGNHPVEQVSWHNAKDFCEKFGAKHGASVRLPTEAEWEYAARAGTETLYYWGNTVDGNYCWYGGNSKRTTHPVGGKRPNAWGLYDMAGNVWEWCEDWYAEDYYAKSPSKDPKGPTSGSDRVLRGGSWLDFGYVLRSALRNRSRSGVGDSVLGFRVVVVASGD